MLNWKTGAGGVLSLKGYCKSCDYCAQCAAYTLRRLQGLASASWFFSFCKKSKKKKQTLKKQKKPSTMLSCELNKFEKFQTCFKRNV